MHKKGKEGHYNHRTPIGLTIHLTFTHALWFLLTLHTRTLSITNIYKKETAQ